MEARKVFRQMLKIAAGYDLLARRFATPFLLRNNLDTIAFGYIGAGSVGAEEGRVAENGREGPEDSQSAG
jgi:hypothetical protein